MLDPQITLFGRKIQVKGDEDYSLSSNNHSCVDLVDKELAEEESMGDNQEENSSAETIDSEKDSESQQDYEKQSNDTKNPEQKQLKKPDKILPCPRCKSMNTKFCYYNNYNINQPRHFCRSCYRYWTAGGTMRNVPVGAGRRKNKTSTGSASRFSHLTDGSHHPGTVLTFGPDNPFCESMVSVVDVDQKTGRNTKKGTHPGVNNVHVPSPFGSYMWNHPGANANVHVPSPIGYPVFPIPIFHHPYWNSPWVGQISSPGSNPSLAALGKHTRDGQMILTSLPNDDNNTNKTSPVLMPKTLRIDNPDEAAKSSIWSTLGIKKDKSESLSKGFFNSFQSKVLAEKDRDLEAPAAFIKANPVALCRSLGFQERA